MELVMRLSQTAQYLATLYFLHKLRICDRSPADRLPDLDVLMSQSMHRPCHLQAHITGRIRTSTTTHRHSTDRTQWHLQARHLRLLQHNLLLLIRLVQLR